MLGDLYDETRQKGYSSDRPCHCLDIGNTYITLTFFLGRMSVVTQVLVLIARPIVDLRVTTDVL